MEINYNRIIDTLSNAIDCCTDFETEDDLKMAIEIVKLHEENINQPMKFEPIFGDGTLVLIDSGTNNYDQIRANFRKLVKNQSKERLKLRLKSINKILELQKHNHQCIVLEMEVIKDRLKEIECNQIR